MSFFSDTANARLVESFEQGFSSKVQYQIPVAPITVSESHCGGGGAQDLISQMIYRYFDYSNLTSDADLSCSIDFSNWQKSELLGTGSPSDRFYCEQAIWQASYFWFLEHPKVCHTLISAKRREQVEWSGTSEQQLFKAHPKLQGHAVALPVIPYYACDITGVVSADDVRSLDNLNAILVSDIGSQRLKEYRADWDIFLRDPSKKAFLDIWDDENPSMSQKRFLREEVINKGAELLRKYSDLFLL